MTPPPTGFEQIRADAVRRMFARTPRLAMLIFEPTFAVLSLYVACTTADPWRRSLSLALLSALVLVNLLQLHKPIRVSLRWLIGVGLVAITGGAESPLLPFLLIAVLSYPSILGGKPALALCGLSIAVVWTLTLAGTRGPAALMHAACMTLLLLAAFAVGSWIRETSDLMLRTSLDARDELLRAYDERLRELNRLQEALAHELKNPLASIKGLACLMQLEPARSPERLDVLRREVTRMQQILDEMLSFSRPLTPMRPQPTCVQTLIGAVVRLHEGVAAHKQLTLDTSLAERVEVFGDPQKLKQLLMNLLLNAIEASPTGATVELTARRDGARLRVQVLDRGPGLDAELLARAIEPGVTTKVEGAGLGLTIVRALAFQHGGALTLRNRDGGGLAAEVELPLKCPHDCAGALA